MTAWFKRFTAGTAASALDGIAATNAGTATAAPVTTMTTAITIQGMAMAMVCRSLHSPSMTMMTIIAAAAGTRGGDTKIGTTKIRAVGGPPFFHPRSLGTEHPSHQLTVDVSKRPPGLLHPLLLGAITLGSFSILPVSTDSYLWLAVFSKREIQAPPPAIQSRAYPVRLQSS